MGRNGKRPPEYVPLLQFNLRSKLEGGKLRVPGELKAGLDAKTRKECLVLVHGFNNTDSEAAVAYLGFRSRQKEIFGTPDFRAANRKENRGKTMLNHMENALVGSLMFSLVGVAVFVISAGVLAMPSRVRMFLTMSRLSAAAMTSSTPARTVGG